MGIISSADKVMKVLFFISIFSGTFGSNAQFLPDDEVQTLRTIFTKLQHRTVTIERTSCSDRNSNFTSGEANRTIICDCTVNSTCHVTRIFLKSLSLPGIFPPEFGNLTRLREIDLSRNYLNGTIPTTLSQTPLEILSVIGNRLSGPIPPQLGDVTTLTNLNLESNLLSGPIPSSLGSLRRLNSLLLSANNFTGQLPESLSNLKNLTDFRIDGNSLSGKIPEFIGNWTLLDRLDLQGTSMSGPIPASLSNLRNLTELRITDLNGPVSDFPDLRNMTRIKRLVLRNCLIRGPIPDYIGSMTELKTLDLSSNMLIGPIPNTFRNLDYNFIFLSNNSLSGQVPQFILDSKDLLDLSYNNFTQAPPRSCNMPDINLVSSYPSATDNSAQWCLRRDLPCSGEAKQSSLFINCGGEATEIGKDTYEEDLDTGGASRFISVGERWAYSSSGSWLGNERAPYLARDDKFNLLNESIPQYYKTARLAPQSLKYYGLCLRSESYKLQLHFAEIMFSNDQTFSSLGRRVFDIYVQGNLLVKDFNIEESAGGVGKPFTLQIDRLQVNGSTLEVHLLWSGKGTNLLPERGVYGPLISAITITPNYKVDDGKPLSNGAVAGIVVAACAFFTLLVLVILRLTGYLGSRKEEDDNEELRGLDLQTGSFTLKQIKRATNNFDPENKIGEGGFGPVYKGVLADGTTIAVKQLSSKSKQGNREFVTEIGMISALQHPNLVKLYGCCIEGKELLLVYEYLENNSLARALFGSEKQRLHLDWPTRNKICIGIAKGLAYLHEESRLKIVHRDIKATNVLLDQSLNAKISDFGLAKLDEEENTHISTRIAGTIGYMAPEYAMRGYLTDKADVYSFGVVCLEIVSGKSNTNYRPKEEFVYLLDWAYVLQEQGNLLELVDMDLGTNFSKKEAKRMLNIALLCTNPSPTLRPPMSSVVSMLEGKSKVEPPLVKREADPNGAAAMRFRAFELLSQDSESQASTFERDREQKSSSSMDGPWVDSSSSAPGKDVNVKQEEDERSSSSSKKLLDDLTEVKVE
ncbi:unnamed protein product [Eruca vesicaria subsp. sativa]|uniref:non-specific serine/threonine protein kinase n=1 Tax=Eruca vesicaria subsp. sativa TaxID=29727 RepID=A0ABC8LV51_ERUVS|nr:unnamed protein product [Eruca vesicaria subsp. sativa]